MHIYNREKGKDILNEVSVYNPYTRYRVEGGTLYASAPGGLADQQKILLGAWKLDIIAYLTVPPAIQGVCCQGHAIEWTCTPYGLWVCSCYYGAKQFEGRAKAANF